MAHLSTARSCKWYRKGKNKAPASYVVPHREDILEQEVLRASRAARGDEDDDMMDFAEHMENRDLFRFILPLSEDGSEPRLGESSSSMSSYLPAPRLPPPLSVPELDEDEDLTFEEEDSLAGVVIRMEETVVEKWKAYFAEDEDDLGDGMEVDQDGGGDRMDVGEGVRDPGERWKPFASELDWRVAMWAVREDVGQNALNRFLSIPGVRS